MNIVSRYIALWTMAGIATINLHAIEPADIPHYEGEESHVIKAANPETLQAKSVTFTQHVAGGPAKNVQTLAPEDVEKRFAVYDKKKEHSDGYAVMGELTERLKKLPKDRYSFSTYKHKQEQELDYLLFLPADYDKTKTYPLILSLHGSGERVENDMLVLAGRNAGPVVAALDQQDKYQCLILTPRTRTGWITSGAAVAGLVDKVIATHSIDTSRVYVMGQSMGGSGTMQMALNHSRLFAAAVPIVGIGSSPNPRRLDCPMWMFTGEFDRGKQRAVEFYEAARDAGKDIRLTVFCLRGHMCHHLVYYHPGFWEWLFSQKKEAAEKAGQLINSKKAANKANDNAPALPEDARKLWPISEYPDIQASYAKGDYKTAIDRALVTADEQDLPEMSARSGVVNQHGLFSPILYKWVAEDPEAATAWALDLPGAEKKPAIVRMKTEAQIWVGAGLVDGGDPRRAAHFLIAAEKNSSRDSLLEKASRLWAEKDLEQAAAWAETIKHAEDRSLAVQGILDPYAKADPPGAVTFAAQIEENFRRHWELCGIAIEWAETDPKKAAALTRTIEQPDARSRAAKAVAARLIREDPNAAFKLLEVIEKQGDWAGALVNTLWHWAEAEPEKALAKAEAIEPGHTQRWALTSVWGGWSKTAPEKVAALVEEAKALTCCGKPGCRFSARKKDLYYVIAGNWAETDPEKAATWLRALPDELRKSILRKSEPHSYADDCPHHKRTREFKELVRSLAAPQPENGG